MTGPAAPDAERLVACFHRGVAAAMPGPAVARALAGRGRPPAPPVVIAVGKAALTMADAAVQFLSRHHLRPAGGLVVVPDAADLAGLPVVAAEHPVPGAGSRRAAEDVGRIAAATPAGTEVWFLLSGGATSLLGGPDDGIDPGDLEQAWTLLLASGLDITAMNAVRKRLTRWGGGKLALALGHTRVLQLIVSDVIGNDLPSIGSGPLAPDPIPTATVVDRLHAVCLWDGLPDGLRQVFSAIQDGTRPDTPKPGHPAFRAVHTEIIVSNEAAVQAAAEAGLEAGWHVEIETTPLAGEAREAGVRIANRLLAAPPRDVPALLVVGGEPTVTIPRGARGRGGRAQELALAAARVLADAPDPSPLLLAAGTDGRDGPTDAAGAVVDADTWRRVAEAGVDPGRALEEHDSWTALEAAGVLLRTGPTGTNVMDLVLGLRPARLRA